MSRRYAECPAPGCGFSDVPSLVAAHVNGTEGAEHDWARLPYDGPGEFLSTARGEAERPNAGDESTDRGEAGPKASDSASKASKSAPDATDSATGASDSASDAPDPTSEASDPASNAADHAVDPDPIFRAVDVVRDRVESVEDGDLAALDVPELADLFVACSVLAGEARSARSDVRAAIIDRVDEEGEIAGTLGSVERSRSTRRALRDEETVRRALFTAGIDPREAESFDPALVRELIEEARERDPSGVSIDEADVFETSESDHVRRASVNEDVFGER